MKPKDIFLIVVRCVGLVTLLYGVDAVLEGILYSIELGSDDRYSARYWGVRGGVQIIVGIFLLRGAKPLVSIAFPEEIESTQHQNPEASRKEGGPFG